MVHPIAGMNQARPHRLAGWKVDINPPIAINISQSPHQRKRSHFTFWTSLNSWNFSNQVNLLSNRPICLICTNGQTKFLSFNLSSKRLLTCASLWLNTFQILQWLILNNKSSKIHWDQHFVRTRVYIWKQMRKYLASWTKDCQIPTNNCAKLTSSAL